MTAFLSYFNELVNKNKQEYNQLGQIFWLNPYDAYQYEEIRQGYIQSFNEKIIWSFKQTKPWINSLSKGCELCGKGEWSCIFITGLCNARCFYCPAPQDKDDLPMAQQIIFDHAEKYADFINHFNYKGVSFSGGEPFLVYDRLLNYLRKIRKNCKPTIYIWMYTNGILASESKLKELRDYGINEIRFDIGATNYQLDHLKKAKGIIENITVEIPLDPNKKDLIKDLLPQLIDFGVSNLNLHQLRLTKYNARNLLNQPYTFLHGEHPVVLESELAVLDILNYVQDSGLPIGINYCSFQFKYRFQKAGYRKKLSNIIVPDETITENGYIMNIYAGDNENQITEKLTEDIVNNLIEQKKIKKISLEDFYQKSESYAYIIVDFSGIILGNENAKGKYQINGRLYELEHGRPVFPILFKSNEYNDLLKILKDQEDDKIPDDDKLFSVWKHLTVERGLRSYL